MKKLLVLLSVFALVMVSGCRKEPVEPTSSVPPARPRIEAVAENPFGAGWNVIGEAEYDVIVDGEQDYVRLVTSAQTEDGVWLFDDSQDWGLVVQTEKGNYELFRKHLHGTVYMDVSEFYHGDEASPVIGLYIFSGAGVEIRQYTYEEGAFYETIAYTTAEQAEGGINRIYSTIPGYYET